MTRVSTAVFVVFLFLATASVAQMADDQLDASALNHSRPHSAAVGPRGGRNGQAHARFGVAGIDSLVNFNQHFNAAGVDSSGNPQVIWYTNFVGNPPQMGGTTTLNAPVVPVSIDMRNLDGTPRFVNGVRLYYDATQYVTPTLQSPVFSNATYSSSDVPTQVTDAIQRAEFYNNMKPNWHTLLNGQPKTPRVMTLIRGTYRFALNADGSCCFFVLVDANTFVNELFPPTYPVDSSTVIGAAEVAGDITTKDLSTFLFPNTFLYVNDPSNCCILGFHTFDFEPGDASNNNLLRFYVVNYSSWISPGVFGDAFTDVTAVSHEIAETYNDPFVSFDNIHDITPWWLAPNGNCQNNLETGDVIEGLANATFPVTMPNGFTYHPQNEALRQWFMEGPSNALDGAFSYPDESVLPQPNAVQNFNCQ